MGPAYFVLALMGCGDNEAECREVRVVPVRYESAAQCTAATETQLTANSDLAYPVLMARCRAASPQMAEGKLKPAG